MILGKEGRDWIGLDIYDLYSWTGFAVDGAEYQTRISSLSLVKMQAVGNGWKWLVGWYDMGDIVPHIVPVLPHLPM